MSSYKLFVAQRGEIKPADYALFALARGDAAEFYAVLAEHPACKAMLLSLHEHFHAATLADAQHRIRSLDASDAARRVVTELSNG